LSVADLTRVIAEFNGLGHPLMMSDGAGSGTTFIHSNSEALATSTLRRQLAAAHIQAGYLPAKVALTSLRHDVDTLEDLQRLDGCSRRALPRRRRPVRSAGGDPSGPCRHEQPRRPAGASDRTARRVCCTDR
jgi:hypothetical protein